MSILCLFMHMVFVYVLKRLSGSFWDKFCFFFGEHRLATLLAICASFRASSSIGSLGG